MTTSVTHLNTLNSLFNVTHNVLNEYKNKRVIDNTFAEGFFNTNDYSDNSYKYIDVHDYGTFNYICIDWDSSDISKIMDSESIPEPNIYIRSNKTNHYHLIYLLEYPVYKFGKMGPLNLFNEIKTKLTRIVGGDISYNNRYIYNPWNTTDYQTTIRSTKKYMLGDFLVYFEGNNIIYNNNNINCEEYPVFPVGMRNTLIFEVMRKFAYSNYIKSIKENFSLFESCCSFGLSINDEFSEIPLKFNEISAIAKSICYFVNRRFSEEQYDKWIEENYSSEKQSFRGSMKNMTARTKGIMHIVNSLYNEVPINAKGIESLFGVSNKTAYNWIKKANLYIETFNMGDDIDTKEYRIIQAELTALNSEPTISEPTILDNWINLQTAYSNESLNTFAFDCILEPGVKNIQHNRDINHQGKSK